MPVLDTRVALRFLEHQRGFPQRGVRFHRGGHAVLLQPHVRIDLRGAPAGAAAGIHFHDGARFDREDRLFLRREVADGGIFRRETDIVIELRFGRRERDGR